MNQYFLCHNGQKVSWSSVCDGSNQCSDGSDEQHCHCQGDVYACLHGNNVSCRIACTTYRRVTCLTYQNTLACEQYLRDHGDALNFHMSPAGDWSIFTRHFDAWRYSACLALGIILSVSLSLLVVYFLRKNRSRFSFPHATTPTNAELIRKSSHRSSFITQQRKFSRSRYSLAPVAPDSISSPLQSARSPTSTGDYYEPPSYPGPPISSAMHTSDSTYYETIKSVSVSNSMSRLNPMPLPEPRTFANIFTHCV